MALRNRELHARNDDDCHFSRVTLASLIVYSYLELFKNCKSYSELRILEK